MTADDLRAFTAPQLRPQTCACAKLNAPGWESISPAVGAPLLQLRGSLRPESEEEPSLEEWPGSHYWAADAPISAQHFPYNRCEVWACPRCGCGYLQYTEFGGYYVDHRLRQIDPALVK
jgi:hypothetical protein